MNLWGRLFTPKNRTTPLVEENVLVISDIHLGEDVVVDGPEHLGEYIRALNHELTNFVAAHADEGDDGRSWHLVINGDMFDFVKLALKPTPEEAFSEWRLRLSPEELAAMPNTPALVVWKLARIVEIHRPLFKEMARFIRLGHRISIIEGNHDTELYFPETQAALQNHVLQEVLRQGGTGEDLETLRHRIQFPGWFTASAGRYHIEHGNQYDPYCSFEYNLAPFESGTDVRMAVPMTHQVMPYFADVLSDFSTHGIEGWSMMQWVRYGLTLGPRLAWVLLTSYARAMVDVLGKSGPKRAAALEGHGERHRARLKELAEQSPYGLETLAALDRLKATPAEYSIWQMMHVFYVDRFLVGAGMLVLGTLGFFLGGGAGRLLAGGVLLGGVALLYVLGRTTRGRVDERLRTAAAGIADRTGARYVVFGHSHEPELVDLGHAFGTGRFGESAYYINSGSWVTREILLGEAGKGMTYVEISRRGAALRRWGGSRATSAVLATTEKPAPQRSRDSAESGCVTGVAASMGTAPRE